MHVGLRKLSTNLPFQKHVTARGW